MGQFDSAGKQNSLTDCGTALSWTSRMDVIADRSKAFATSLVRKSTEYLLPEANFKSKLDLQSQMIKYLLMFYYCRIHVEPETARRTTPLSRRSSLNLPSKSPSSAPTTMRRSLSTQHRANESPFSTLTAQPKSLPASK